MSTPVKRTLIALIAAIVMAALSSVFAITLARLTRQHAQAMAEDLGSLGPGAAEA